MCIHFLADPVYIYIHAMEGGGNSGLAQRSPVSQGNTLLSAVIINIFSLKIDFLRLHFEVLFCTGDLNNLKRRLIMK